MLLSGQRIGTGPANHTVDMLGRTVDRVEFQGGVARRLYIMPCPLRDDDAVVRLNRMALTIDPHLAASRFDSEELIVVLMHLSPISSPLGIDMRTS